MEKSEEEITLVTDSSYGSQDNIALAKEKNIRLVTTALSEKETLDALADLYKNPKTVQQCHLDKETRSIIKEMRREPTPNRLLLFPVSRLRIPKTPDFC